MNKLAISTYNFTRSAIIALVAVAMVLSAFAYIQPANAAGLTALSIVTSGSKPNTAVNLRIQFQTATQIDGDTTADDKDGEIFIRFPDSSDANERFGIASATASDITLVSGWPVNVTVKDVIEENNDPANAANDTYHIELNQTNGGSAINILANTTLTFDILNQKVTLPNAGNVYPISIETRTNGGVAALDSGATNIGVVSAVSGSATVEDTLIVTVTGVGTNTSCRSITTDASATVTSTALPFGTLAPNTPKSLCQNILIDTNAPNGYDIYVVQTQNLTSGSDIIDEFNNGNRVDDGSAILWEPPEANAQNPSTWGHLGYGSDDSSVFDNNGKYAGIPLMPASNAAPVTTGLVADASSSTTGTNVKVEFRAEVSSLQPGGSYTNEIQYIVVAKY